MIKYSFYAILADLNLIVSDSIRNELISEIYQKNYPEIIEYKHERNNLKAVWKIPEIMMKPV